MDTEANRIVECFNQKDTSCMQTVSRFFWKELWGKLSHKMSTNCVSSTQSLTLIPYESNYLYWQSPITVSGKVRGWNLHCMRFLQNEKQLVPHTRCPVHGQDYFGYASNKCQLWTRLQRTEKGEVLSPYNHVEQLPQSSYDMHSS